ncbi:UDP-N-acetylglucosamine--N-acetylmuramyl-(pentapeptide) pyrophosphoryl-undecaprenol N-acetylglucosamine transferase [Candidatus Parcubacteria bacterium]|nr:UDP-N-acetylglucosamine--N-acetylmuramyl-(pentapeptide) pyrophosphoryl-undecaprenol N-acetylglucosamine transferase [Candidatus Parcubacteria bacterium]
MKLLFIGGHHTSAIAVIEALVEKQGSSLKDFSWIGHKYSMWGDKNPGAEYCEITALGIPFYDLKAGKLYRTFHPLKLVRIPFGFLQAFYFLLKIKPDLIVSFGGYLAVPVVMAGWLRQIPVVTCEQTVVSGWANRVVARFARKIFVAWEQSEKFFPKSKVAVTGLPLRREILEPISPPLASDLGQFLKAAERVKKPIIYITGGKQGSHTINQAVAGVLEELLRNYSVIHQCGSSSVFNDYKNLKAEQRSHYFKKGEDPSDSEGTKPIQQFAPKARTERNRVPPRELGVGIYLVQEYFSAAEVGAIFKACDLVVSRSGAHTIYELAALGKPALLVPIPWVSHNEQERNARILTDLGAAKLLPQKELTSESLLVQLKEMMDNLESYQVAAQQARKLVKLDAAERIAKGILNEL